MTDAQTFIKNNLFNMLLTAGILTLVGMTFMQSDKAEAIHTHSFAYNSEWCVEWEGGMTRSRLVNECYNFVNQEILCDWEISFDDDSLRIYEYKNPDVTISQAQCTRYAPTRLSRSGFSEGVANA